MNQSRIPRKHHINKLHNVKVTVVTPVSIGDGGQISPLADFYYDKNTNKVYFLNKPIFEKLLLNSQHLNAYIKEVNEVVNTNKNTTLLAFLKRATGLSENEVLQEYFHSDPIRAIGVKNAVETATIIKNIDQPYIPGSTLKGAVRSAILYQWLVTDSHRHKILDRYLEGLQKWDKINHRKDKRTKEEISGIKKMLFDEEALFGNLKKGQDSRKIKVSDSQPVKLGMAIVQCERIPLRISKQGAKESIPILREALWTAQPLTFTIGIESPISHPALRYLEESDTEGLLAKFSEFAKDNVALEKYLLEGVLDKSNVHPQIEQLYNFYSKLERRMENGETFLRLGFGKTQYNNSLVLAPYHGFEDEDDAYESFGLLRILLWKLKEDQLDYYPATRLLTASSEPMGWVKMEVAK